VRFGQIADSVGIGAHLRKVAGTAGLKRLNTVRAVANSIAQLWRSLAPNARYRMAIKVNHSGKFEFTVSLRGTVPNIIEHGVGPGGVGTSGPWNLSTSLLRSNVKFAKSGGSVYRVIKIPGVGFRVTSSLKRPWIHPGVTGRRIAMRIRNMIPDLIRELS
jgi:hypothetical protein